MLVLFDKISSKLLYLFDVNGTLRDSNGLPYYPKGNGILKDINGKKYLVDQNKLINTDIYGVEWNINDADPLVTRIGKMELHNAITGLPVQNKMRRCVVLDNGNVNYYLNPNNSLQKENGTPSLLDGTDGQVMVEIPLHYRKFETQGDIQRVLISEKPFNGAREIPLQYISAFEATVERSTSKLSSVINTSTDYRGGNNNSSFDNQPNSFLGMPATSLSRINFTDFARNRGPIWDQMLYETYKNVIWLYMIEYANRNSQDTFTNTLTVDGYRQGALGTGVTNINSTDWSNFNGINPFISCGSAELNNFTSSTDIIHPVLGATQIPQYRGIEHPFGHIWKWGEGINVRSMPLNIEMYVTQTRDFSNVGYVNYDLISELSISNGFIRDIVFGENGEIMPTVTAGASSTTFWSDQYFQSRPSTGESLRAVIFGGRSANGSIAGLFLSTVNNFPTNTNSDVGSRLCFVTS